MPPPILYDGLRLFLGAASRTPRGVDRVDLSYAGHLLEHWPNECLGVLPTPWGIRLYSRERALRLLETVKGSWREAQGAGGDPAYGRLRAWLTGGPASDRPSAGGDGLLRRAVRLMRENGLHLGDSAIACAPRNSLYLNIGQLGWATPVTTRWLGRRPDIRSVFMMYDVIPLHHPGLVSDGARLSQKWMLRSVLRRADGLITTTQAASEAVRAALGAFGRAEVPVHALPLPVAGVFLQPDPPDEELRAQPYFVVCGAIEPRKNHQLLLRTWLRLLRRVGDAAPRLVVVGTPAHQGEQIVRQILQSPELRDHVTIVSGLATPSVRALMRSARAVLMPSLAEGFGLPVIEALAVGTPVLASDLAAHREAGGDLAAYLDPWDEIAWADAVMGIVDHGGETSALRQRIARYRPFTAADYFAAVSLFLSGFGGARPASASPAAGLATTRRGGPGGTAGATVPALESRSKVSV